MDENAYRNALFVWIAVWASGFTIAIVGVGAALTGLGPWWAGVAIGGFSGFVGGIAGARVTYRPSMHEAVTGRFGVVAFVGVPIVALSCVLAYIVLSPAPENDVAAAGLAGAIVITIGGPATLLANVPLWKARLRANTTCHAEWTARQPPRDRRQTTYAVIALGVLTLGFVGLTVVLQSDFDGTTLFAVFIGFGGALAGRGRERHVEVRDDGLLVNATLVPWRDCTHFECTDHALVVHRSSRWFSRTYKFDVDDVDNLETATSALEDFLPRRDDA